MKNNILNWKKRMLVMLMVFVGCIQLTWASDMEFSASVGISGQYKSNRSIPIAVTLNNTKGDFAGEVQIELKNSGMAYSQRVNVSEGSSQTIIIPIDNIDNNYTSAQVKLIDQSGKKVSEQTVPLSNGRSWPEDKLTIGLLSDDTASLSYFSGIDLRLNSSYQTIGIDLPITSIDEKVKNIDMFDLIVINNFNTSQLLPEQVESIKNWVRQGRTLIIGTGINGNKTLSGLTENLLPIQLGAVETKDMQLFGQTLKTDIVQPKITEDSLIKAQEQSKSEYYDVFKLGAGKIILAKYDLGMEPIISFDRNQEWWKLILVGEVNDNIQNYNNYYYVDNNLGRVLNKDLPSTMVLVLVLMIYIVVMGIVTYVILKKKGKKEYIWGVAPILALITTLSCYGLSMRSKLAAFVVNQLEVIQVDEANNANKVNNIAVLNTRGKDLEVKETDDMSFAFMGRTEDYMRYCDPNEERKLNRFTRYEGDKISYQMTNCSVYDKAAFISRAEEVEAPDYKSSLVMKDAEYVINFTNTSDREIEDLIVMIGQQIWNLGPVEIGEEINQELSGKSYRHLYDILDEYDNKQGSELYIVLNTLIDGHLNGYELMPRYVALSQLPKEKIDFIKGESQMDIHYQAVIKDLTLEAAEDGKVVYPYEYFKPTIEGGNGLGYVDEDSPVITICDDAEVELTYNITPECQVEWFVLGNDEADMSDYYFTNLKGEVCLYNYTTQSYEPLTLSLNGQYCKIEGEALKDYLKDSKVKIKVVGKGEDNGLVPSIKLGGTAHASN